jgi:hypothetical protein
MPGQRPLAIVKEYDDLLDAARARKAQLGITFATLDDVSVVQPGYSAKLLGPVPTKNFGPMSFSAIMGALGVKLVMVEDPVALAQVRGRLVKRKRKGRQCTGYAQAVA